MRDLSNGGKNKMLISDARSGTDIELYYRNPTTQEEVDYHNKMFKRVGNKLVVNAYQTRLEYGLKILTGFREGDLGIDGKPISAETNDWKGLLRDNAPDIVNAFAMAIFEGARANPIAVDLDGEDKELPLA